MTSVAFRLSKFLRGYFGHRNTLLMTITGTLMNSAARYVTFMQVNVVIPIFHKRFLRPREATGMVKPLSCLGNTELHELETYF